MTLLGETVNNMAKEGQVTDSLIMEKITRDEAEGEKVISKFRLALGIIYAVSVPVIAFIVYMDGGKFLPARAYIFNNLFLFYSIFLFILLRKREIFNPYFKYICVIIDMTIITASIWVGCSYIEIAPPIKYLSIWALFYFVLILSGALRYSFRCAVFSGIFASLCYIIVIIANSNVLDFPYYFILENRRLPVSFPLYNESFRVLAMILTGLITGIACKRHLSLLNNTIESQVSLAMAASETIEQTRIMATTIHKSTDEIFHSSRQIFSTANSQAASVQEIEATMKENALIAGDIADKTSNVASIASKMESDVIHGFGILEQNVGQLESIKNKNDSVISGIIALGNKITKIRDIIKSINSITDQTKVIAFNAALEAASAGEHGKRFAVVADEVNRLTNDITALTRQIKEQAEEISGSSAALIISSEESADKINEGGILIRELEEIFREIRDGAEVTADKAQTITISTQKQQKSTQQINAAVTDISKGLTSFIQSTMIATSSAEDLMNMINELSTLLREE
jgi:methyl-accepting chemotaxis protein